MGVMDPEIKQLQEEVKRLTEVNKDTNRMVHGMRRSQRWHTFVSILWWFLILGTAGASYLYLQPYIQKATQAYGNAKDFQVEVQNFFAQFGHKTP